MFLSTYENKLDKKGRVSVPASFRSHLSNLGYNGFICYPSFNNASIEACSQDRIEKISSAIDSLNPFEEKRDYFATSILSESINLQFDSEGRISLSSKLLKHAKIKNSMLFVGQGQTFQIWEPATFGKFDLDQQTACYFLFLHVLIILLKVKFFLHYRIVNLYFQIILMLQKNLFFLRKDLKSLLHLKFFQFYLVATLLLIDY